MLPKEPEDLVQQAGVTPAFLGAYGAAPEEIRGPDGLVYRRDDARNSQERIWYLAAVAMRDPRLLRRIATMDVLDMARGFDEAQVQLDQRVRSALDAKTQADAAVNTAQASVTVAQTKLRADSSAVRSIQRQIDTTSQILKQNSGVISDPGSIIAGIFTGGISAAGQYADQKTRAIAATNTITGLQNQLSQLDIQGDNENLKAAQDDLLQAQINQRAAAKALTVAQSTVRKELRDAEKAAADAAAKQSQDDAAAQAASAAQANAAQQQQWMQSQYGDQGETVDWGTDITGDAGGDGSDMGDASYLDLDEQADLWGDEDYAHSMAELNDETIGTTQPRINPYGFDEYYRGYEKARDAVYGADTGQIVTGIVAGVIAAAPAVIKAISPPPSKDASGADTNPGAAGANADTILDSLGLKKTIDDAAVKAGQAAGNSAGDKTSMTLNTWLLVGAAGVALILILKKKG